ncbi:uncharacterized protein LY89DRAFT_667154 [Mollisia scopiformis]|uniref:Uncharacterized protein n=1 Tax=Mollisia scopiformis TaxID=149040 RepID=A0A194XG36_MOLSC|nr:uncharacterized protein LY89DRAFT_667154 [Mollisia scopiformis]KUJ19160.1 hypothetical protein LY89DRAFT_667154 [Mollisia scopiformis]
MTDYPENEKVVDSHRSASQIAAASDVLLDTDLGDLPSLVSKVTLNDILEITSEAQVNMAETVEVVASNVDIHKTSHKGPKHRKSKHVSFEVPEPVKKQDLSPYEQYLAWVDDRVERLLKSLHTLSVNGILVLETTHLPATSVLKPPRLK